VTENVLDTQMLEAMWESGATAAAEELGEGMTYDLDYANEHADATAMLVAKRTHLAYADVRALATE